MIFTELDARNAADALGIDFDALSFSQEDLLMGMNIELEHGKTAGDFDITGDDPLLTAKLALSHLMEMPTYYNSRNGLAIWKEQLKGGMKKKPKIREYKTLAFELENIEEEDGGGAGIFSGHASVFSNIDDGDDIVEPGAFTKTIAEGTGRVKILFGHNDEILPIGKPIELREDGKGLYMRAQISDTAIGRDVKTLLRDGVLSELSIGFDPIDWYHDEHGIRHLREVRLWEVSVVTWAMNPQATVTAYKKRGAAQADEREITIIFD